MKFKNRGRFLVQNKSANSSLVPADLLSEQGLAKWGRTFVSECPSMWCPQIFQQLHHSKFSKPLLLKRCYLSRLIRHRRFKRHVGHYQENGRNVLFTEAKAIVQDNIHWSNSNTWQSNSTWSSRWDAFWFHFNYQCRQFVDQRRRRWNSRRLTGQKFTLFLLL